VCQLAPQSTSFIGTTRCRPFDQGRRWRHAPDRARPHPRQHRCVAGGHRTGLGRSPLPAKARRSEGTESSHGAYRQARSPCHAVVSAIELSEIGLLLLPMATAYRDGVDPGRAAPTRSGSTTQRGETVPGCPHNTARSHSSWRDLARLAGRQLGARAPYLRPALHQPRHDRAADNSPFAGAPRPQPPATLTPGPCGAGRVRSEPAPHGPGSPDRSLMSNAGATRHQALVASSANRLGGS
jgi:hypothetical protein